MIIKILYIQTDTMKMIMVEAHYNITNLIMHGMDTMESYDENCLISPLCPLQS